MKQLQICLIWEFFFTSVVFFFLRNVIYFTLLRYTCIWNDEESSQKQVLGLLFQVVFL